MTIRVAVVGGGVIGTAVAWRVARDGPDVTVVDPDPGRGASWAAAGMLAPVTEAHLGEEDVLALNRRSVARWPAFARELADASGHDVDLHTAGTVVAARDADDLRHLDDLADRLAELGLDVERLRGRDLRRREPALSPRVRGGLDVPGDHAVDNREVVAALQAAGEQAGVVHRTARATAVETTDGRVTAVACDDGSRVPADVVVVAAGWASGRLSLPAAARPPVRPVKGQILRLQDDPSTRLLARVVRGRAHGWPVYLVPRSHGEVVVGATVEDRGEDTTVTVGGTLDLLRAAAELVPGVRELPVVETRAGLRPGTPDNAPVIGPTSIDGLVLATGHFRHGILQAPLTGDAVAALLADGAMPAEMAPFTPGRFAS